MMNLVNFDYSECYVPCVMMAIVYSIKAKLKNVRDKTLTWEQMLAQAKLDLLYIRPV